MHRGDAARSLRLFHDAGPGVGLYRWQVAQATIIARSVEKADAWLEQVAGQLGSDDRRLGYRVLRAYLHALRDRLTVDEAAQLAAQLPDLIRGIYYENWRPSATPVKYSGFADFLERVAAEASLDGEPAAAEAVGAAAGVLRSHVSAGEIENIRAQLPEDLLPILG
jgi:uncharacterized protein (DUF2267 family)